jgi:hypothetical protein
LFYTRIGCVRIKLYGGGQAELCLGGSERAASSLPRISRTKKSLARAVGLGSDGRANSGRHRHAANERT